MLIQIQEPEEESATPRIQAVGIDLGTTHSLVAIASEGIARVLTFDGSPLVPSLWGLEAGKAVCGLRAKTLQKSTPEKIVSSIKRLMGRGLEDEIVQQFPHLTQEIPGRGMALQLGEEMLTPVEISAAILKHLFDGVHQALGYPVTQAVITVPAYFDEAARQATRDAAQLAGFTVLRLLSEPTAAALAYGLDQGIEGLYGVFDLGGGTFDFSLLRMEKGVFQVLATGGDLSLGGDDMDFALARHLGGDGWHKLTRSEKTVALEQARRLKEALSQAEEIPTNTECENITRATFESLISPLVHKMFSRVRKVLADGAVSTTDLQGILLVGGATRVPLIREYVSAFLGKEPISSLDPDQVVALGAALQAEALTYGAQHLLLDVTPLSLGIEVMGNQVEPLIRRNTRIPVSVTQTFTTSEDGQAALRLHVLQGENPVVEGCRSLAHFELWGIPPLPAGQARVDVTFSLDTDGLLTVRAQEKTTGIHQEIQIKPSYDLTPDAVREMILSD